MLRRIFPRIAPQQFAGSVEVQQFGPSRDLLPRISPHRAVGWIRPNAQHGQKVVAPGGHEVRDAAFSGDLYDLTAALNSPRIKKFCFPPTTTSGASMSFFCGGN